MQQLYNCLLSVIELTYSLTMQNNHELSHCRTNHSPRNAHVHASLRRLRDILVGKIRLIIILSFWSTSYMRMPSCDNLTLALRCIDVALQSPFCFGTSVNVRAK